MTRIFISYSRKDEAFARRLAGSLEQMGADIWVDLEDIPAGLKWSSAIQQGLDSAEVMIVVITPESMGSRNVEDEWQYFLDNNKPVIPVLLRASKIHFQLSRLQYIDFLNARYEDALERLKYELARRGFPLGIPMSAPMTPPPPQSFGHPTGGQSAYVTSLKPSSSLRVRGLIAGGITITIILGIGLLAILIQTAVDGPRTLNSVDMTRTAIQNMNSTTIALMTATAADGVRQPTGVLSATPVPAEPTHTPVFVGPVAHNGDWTVRKQDFNGVSMVLVPGGQFTMGAGQRLNEGGENSDKAICARQLNAQTCDNVILADETSVQTVTLQPFWIDTYEAADASRLPINNITWLDAERICEARGGRLPTEAEWEYAVRGPDGWRYPWGDQYDGARMNVCDESCRQSHSDYTWADRSYNDGYADRAPVGSFPSGRSWVGAEDLAGNLWEWTSTIYAQDIRNGRENNADTTPPRVLKGSSWNWVGVEGRGTARADIADSVRDSGKSDWYGFRCVRDFKPEDVGLPG